MSKWIKIKIHQMKLGGNGKKYEIDKYFAFKNSMDVNPRGKVAQILGLGVGFDKQ